MPSILDLSNELLYKIIDYVHPDDITNFSLSRRVIQLLAKNALSLHRQRQRTYENVKLYGCHRHCPNGHPLQLIQDICMDWRVGEYPKSLIFECCDHPEDPEMPDFDEDEDEEDEEDTKRYEVEKREDKFIVQATMQAIQGYIEEKVTESGISKLQIIEVGDFHGESTSYLSPFDVSDALSEAKRGHRGAMLAFLLLFVPNLEAISLDQATWCNAHLDSVIHCTSEQHLQPRPRVRNILMNLSRVCFLGSRDNEEGENFELFISFAALPSMRTIFGDFVEGRYEADSPWEFPPHSSNVTEITLQDSAVKAQYLTNLLVGIRALKRFTYDHNERLGRGRGMEAHMIIGALLEHAKHSLEYLALTGNYDTRERPSDIHPCKGSLRGFEVLKDVVVNSQIYLEPASDDESLDTEELSPLEDQRLVIQHFVDVLPPSIKTIELVGPKAFDHALGLLDSSFDRREICLPMLSKLSVRLQYPLRDDWKGVLRERCEKVGLVLET